MNLEQKISTPLMGNGRVAKVLHRVLPVSIALELIPAAAIAANGTNITAVREAFTSSRTVVELAVQHSTLHAGFALRAKLHVFIDEPDFGEF